MMQDWPQRCDIVQRGFVATLEACGGRADLVMTSPPYCDARDYGADVVWRMADYASLGEHVFSALRPGGHALINVDAPVREWRPGMGTERGLHPWRLMIAWADLGFRVPDRLAFGRFGIPGEYRGRFRNDWEPLLWFQKPGGEGFFDRTPLRARGAGHGQKNIGGRRRDGEIRKRLGSCSNAAAAWRLVQSWAGSQLAELGESPEALQALLVHRERIMSVRASIRHPKTGRLL